MFSPLVPMTAGIWRHWSLCCRQKTTPALSSWYSRWSPTKDQSFRTTYRHGTSAVVLCIVSACICVIFVKEWYDVPPVASEVPIIFLYCLTSTDNHRCACYSRATLPSWLADWWLSSAYLSRREPIAGRIRSSRVQYTEICEFVLL